MSWSGGIVGKRGAWVKPKGEEAAAWRAARDAHIAKYGQAPHGFENGYICMSDTYVTASKMGYSIADMDLDPMDVAQMAQGFELERPHLLESEPDRAFYADYLVSFFKTAARFGRGIRGGH